MRSVHILGLGFIVGMIALGVMLAVIGYRWQQEALAPETADTEFPPESAPGPVAPEEVARGMALFQQRCSSCHTIGGGRRVGPDLENVATRRPHDWIIEFIVDPQEVIARNDPIAQELLGEYQVEMPDTNTTPEEAEDILAYIQSESEGGPGGIKTAPGNVLTPGPPGVGPTPGVQEGTPGAGVAPGAAGTPAAPAPGQAQPTPAASPQPTAPEKAAQPTPQEPAGQPPGGAQVSGDAAAGQQLFQGRCTGCHTIGGGPLAGPDLEGITQRRPPDELVQFIVDPQQFGSTMPDVGITPEQSQDIVAYLAAQGGEAAAPGAPAPEVSLPEGDPRAGRALFVGEQQVSGGGPACIACHDAEGAGALGGGTWAIDLTGAVGRLGTQGFVSIVKSPPFPAMDLAYGPDAISDQDAAHLAAFLQQAEQAGGAPRAQDLFVIIGLVVFGAMAGASHFIWRGRSREPREPRPGNR